jgi:diphthamide biosynthesis enzyme Dph1/Dph2-like protein
MNYDLELEKVIKKIKRSKAKIVCIQLPDGLKPEANNIVNELEKKTKAMVLIWSGSCYGACDIPLGLSSLGVELLICYGHNKFNKVIEGW